MTKNKYMEEQNQQIQPNIPEPNTQPEIPQEPKLPTWMIVLITVLTIAVIGGAGYVVYQYYSISEPEPIACTLEAKVCPDGSSVGRTGLNCEFAECPEVVEETVDWQTYKNKEYGFEVKYPNNWQIKELNNKQILFIDEEKTTKMGLSGILRIEILEDVNTKDIIEWLNNMFYKGAEQEIIPIYKDFVIDGMPAVRFSTPELPGCDDEVVSFKNNNAFLIYKFGDTCDYFSVDLYNQILSTFKFKE